MVFGFPLRVAFTDPPDLGEEDGPSYAEEDARPDEEFSHSPEGDADDC